MRRSRSRAGGAQERSRGGAGSGEVRVGQGLVQGGGTVASSCEHMLVPHLVLRQGWVGPWRDLWLSGHRGGDKSSSRMWTVSLRCQQKEGRQPGGAVVLSVLPNCRSAWPCCLSAPAPKPFTAQRSGFWQSVRSDLDIMDLHRQVTVRLSAKHVRLLRFASSELQVHMGGARLLRLSRLAGRGGGWASGSFVRGGTCRRPRAEKGPRA